MTLYWITVLVSAFLLFLVQPMAARMILPWFGGGSAVWNACMVFFQTALLLGYLYAHWLHGLRTARRQAIVHCSILAASLLALPIVPAPGWKAAAVEHPTLRILMLLAATVGLPYFALSSTSPLLQAWYARKSGRPVPYRLFAISNLGSLAALVAYPILIEPRLRVSAQAIMWSAAYACFCALCGAIAWAHAVRNPHPEPAGAEDAGGQHGANSTWPDRTLWLGLSCAASMLLLSLTTHLTQNVAPIPLLWVAPLGVYLLSFILCFEFQRVYRRIVFLPLCAAAVWFMAYRLRPGHAETEIRWLIPLLVFGLFSCCMVCHGELARLKPHPSRLTEFYVAISLGGALGGSFVGILAPQVFNEYAEYPIALGLCVLLGALAWARSERRGGRARILLAGPAVAIAVFLVWLGMIVRGLPNDCRVVVRNFYGQLRVRDIAGADGDGPARRRLIHGKIIHGEQASNEPLRRSPGTYFCPPSGIGRAMAAIGPGPRRIGILGLGCGTLAAYARAGDIFRIYEINPFVVRLAQTEFTYLRDSRARVEIAVGDGRLAIESEQDQKFDLLVMDAFSGDSVPVHLITLEAFRAYFRHLKTNGILAVNISNRYLDLAPVVGAAAAGLGRVALRYYFEPVDGDPICYTSDWALILGRTALTAYPQLRDGAEGIPRDTGFRPWTDDYSGILTILRTAKM